MPLREASQLSVEVLCTKIEGHICFCESQVNDLKTIVCILACKNGKNEVCLGFRVQFGTDGNQDSTMVCSL